MAGENRRGKARVLIKSVKISIDNVTVPAFTNVKVDSIQYYQKTEKIINNINEWESALVFARQRLLAAQTELNILNSLAQDNNKRKTVVARAIRHTNTAVSVLGAQC